MEDSTDQKTDTVEEDIKSVTNDEVVDENETEENDEVPENIRKIKILLSSNCYINDQSCSVWKKNIWNFIPFLFTIYLFKFIT